MRVLARDWCQCSAQHPGLAANFWPVLHGNCNADGRPLRAGSIEDGHLSELQGVPQIVHHGKYDTEPYRGADFHLHLKPGLPVESKVHRFTLALMNGRRTASLSFNFMALPLV